MKKLALYLVQYGGGGMERLMDTLSSQLSSRFSSVDIILCRGKGQKFNTAKKDNISIYDLKCNFGHGELYAVFSIPKLIRYLKKHKPDILMSSPGYCTVTAIMACKLARVKTKIVSIYDDSVSLLKQKRWYHKILFFLLKCLMPYSDYVVVPFSKARDDIIKNISISKSKVHIIPHPVVDDSLYEKSQMITDDSPFENSKDIPRLLFVGRLAEEKGVFYLLEAFLKVLKTINARLYIVGDGPQKAEIEYWIDTNNLGDKITMLGYQSNPFPYYKLCNALILPSKMEAYGLVIIEALSLGCPVVAADTKSKGPSTILEGGKYGILCLPEDPDSLAEGILLCLNKKWDRDMLIKRGLKYSVKSSVEKYIKLLKNHL